MILDPTTDIGKVRLRVADFSDLPFLPDSVYNAVLVDNGGSLTAAAKTISIYILGLLSMQTHERLNQLEVWGSERFKQYKEFLLLTNKDPSFMSFCPIPFYSESGDGNNAIQQFQSDWNQNFTRGTESQQLAWNALFSPNDGSTYGGMYGSEQL